MQNFFDMREKPTVVSDAIFDADLTIHEKLVYLYLCLCASNNMAFPSYNEIAERCTISKNTAINAINGLIEKGCIGKENRINSKNAYDSNIYCLNDIPAGILKV